MDLKDYLAPKNWRNYIQGNTAYLGWKNNLGRLPSFKLEQILLRAYLCRDCLKNKKCLVCKCATPNLFFSKDKVDSKKLWPEWQEDVVQWVLLKQKLDDWKTFENILRTNNIDITDPDIFSFIESIPAKREVESKTRTLTKTARVKPEDSSIKSSRKAA